MPCAGTGAKYGQLFKAIATVVRHHCQTHRVLNHGIEQIADERTIAAALNAYASRATR